MDIFLKPNKFSSEHIKNEVLMITSETESSGDCFEIKIQAKFDKCDQILKQTEE